MSKAKKRKLWRELRDAVCTCDVVAAKRALEDGLDVNAPVGEHNEPALILAALLDKEPIARLLLDAGAYIEAKDYQERTALLCAPVLSPVFDLLLEHGADLHVRDEEEQTILMRAITDAPSIEAVQKLINCGIDPSAQDEEGKTALSIARSYGLVAIAGLLEKVEAASQLR